MQVEMGHREIESATEPQTARESRLRRRLAGMIRYMAGSILVGAAVLAAMIADVNTAAQNISATTEGAPIRPVAIVFGAGYSSQGLSLVLEDRVRTAVDLYRAGRVRKLLMTGDNSRMSYNEPVAMRRFAESLGVPDGDIVLDYAGFRTYDSLYRARDIFGIRDALLVTQSYHLPRALYTARRLGIEASGVAAERHAYPEQRFFNRREILAICNAWIQTNITRPRPHFLGPKEPIL
jgi:vancomycin permeability regulator SanA